MLCRGRRPHHAHRDHVGTWEIPRSASGGKPPWSASGRRGAEADDARTWEVRLRHSSGEADEQGRASGCRAGGAKGGGRGKCEPAKHAPGTVPGKRVTGAPSAQRSCARSAAVKKPILVWDKQRTRTL